MQGWGLIGWVVGWVGETLGSHIDDSMMDDFGWLKGEGGRLCD